MRVKGVVRRAIARSHHRLIENQQGLFEGHNPEAVHQARVATRRLRSDLRSFERFVDRDWAEEMSAELRWLGADLGAVRDIDVMLDRLRGHATVLPPVEAEAVAHVLRRLEADRKAARATLLTSLRSARYAQLRHALAAAAERPPLTKRGRRAGRGQLRRVVLRRWERLRRSTTRLGTSPSDDALHGVRMHAKQCRYAAEACEPAFGRPARRFAEAVTGMQDLLGEHHDAVVALAWLTKTAHECAPSQAYALGRLAEIEHRFALDAAGSLDDAWRRARRKRLRAWL